MNSRSLRTLAVSALIAASVGAGGSALAGSAGSAAPATPVAVPVAVQAAPVAPAATITVNLCASDGSITLPDSTVVPVWGFVESMTCTTGMVNNTNFPGPTIHAIAGDTVNINLTNALSEPTSVLIPGLSGGASGSLFAAEAAAGGGTQSYSFAAAAGTYLYESGSNGGVQVPMGLFGALVIDDAVAGAYGPGTEYDVEAVLLLSEIDPNLNADPGGFDPQDYHPTYWLINGSAYNDTATIDATAGDRVLLRYLNAGFDNPSMMLLGAHQQVIAKQSYELTNAFSAVAEIVPAGSTMDAFVDTSGMAGSYPLYNRNGFVTNGDMYPGGMLTFLNVATPVGTPPVVDIVNPGQGSTVFGDMVAIQIDATDVEDAAGSLSVEWNVDGGAWQTASWTGAYYEASWDTTGLGDGAHAVGARATDSDTNTTTESHSAIVSNVPAVSIVSPTEGSTTFGDAVLVQIDASDAEDAPGSLTVTWDVDGGGSAPAVWNLGSGYYEATLDSTLLTDGGHTINAQATDSRSNTANDSNGTNVSNMPSVSVVTPAEGGTVSGIVTIQIDATDAEDAPGSLTVMWDVDGGTPLSAGWNGATGYYEAVLNSGSLSGGAHTINASATDSRTNTANDSNAFSVGANSIHVGDLDGASVPGGGPNWTASVTVTVHRVDESAVAGATVTINAARTRKSNGTLANSTLSCVTNGAGQCTVSQSVNSNQFENHVIFTVTNVTDTAPYNSGLNHDPDTDSDGTTIDVPQ